MPSVFDLAFDDLPDELAIFPLTGVLLLPDATVPLNIFEPRYLNMIAWALSNTRLIGMIQPRGANEGERPEVYKTGCAGRITSFSETDDGRYLISLNGLVRFDIVEEKPLRDGFRTVVPDWSPYRDDFADLPANDINRDRIVGALKAYFAATNVDANWEAIRETGTARLVNALSMMCPFQPSEKQALLEAPSLARRAETLIALLEMSVAANDYAAPPLRN